MDLRVGGLIGEDRPFLTLRKGLFIIYSQIDTVKLQIFVLCRYCVDHCVDGIVIYFLYFLLFYILYCIKKLLKIVIDTVDTVKVPNKYIRKIRSVEKVKKKLFLLCRLCRCVNKV